MEETEYLKRVNQTIFKKSWGRIFKRLSDEEAGILIKAIYGSWSGKIKEPDRENLIDSFYLILDELDDSAYRYLKKAGFNVED